MEKMQKKMSGLEPRDVLIRLCVGVFSKAHIIFKLTVKHTVGGG